MRRVTQALTLALTSLLVLVLPAAAGEEAPQPPAEGFGSGQWDGLILAAIFGVVLGIVLFLDAYTSSDDQ